MSTFTELYHKRADYLFFLCTRLEADEEKSELLFQDAWRRIHRQWPQLQGENEESWLCSKLIESHRQLNRKFQVFGSLQDDAGSLQTTLNDALMRLSPEYRWPLVLKECTSFGYREIAEILGTPEGTVRARMGRARALLRRFQEVAD